MAIEFTVYAQTRNNGRFDKEANRMYYNYTDNKIEDTVNKIKVNILQGESVIVEALGARNVGFLLRVIEVMGEDVKGLELEIVEVVNESRTFNSLNGRMLFRPE